MPSCRSLQSYMASYRSLWGTYDTLQSLQRPLKTIGACILAAHFADVPVGCPNVAMEAPKFVSIRLAKVTICSHLQPATVTSLSFVPSSLNISSLLVLFRLCFSTCLLPEAVWQQFTPRSIQGTMEATLQHGLEGIPVQERVGWRPKPLGLWNMKYLC